MMEMVQGREQRRGPCADITVTPPRVSWWWHWEVVVKHQGMAWNRQKPVGAGSELLGLAGVGLDARGC